MRIAIATDHSKFDLTKQFFINNQHILLKHKIFANSSVLNLIFPDNLKQTYNFTLNISDEKQVITSKILNGEIDIVFLFRDHFKPLNQNKIDLLLINACDEMSIPFATNFNSAKIIVSSLQWFQ